MQYQQTISNSFKISGIDVIGGNLVEAIFLPGTPDSGVVFNTRYGDVRASLENATTWMHTLLLKKGKAQVLVAEHCLATLYAFGVDNVRIYLNRVDPRTTSNDTWNRRLSYLSYELFRDLGLGAKAEVFPNIPGEEKTLCRMLEGNLESQDVPRKIIRIDSPFEGFSDTQFAGKKRFDFYPRQDDLFTMTATTNYRPIGLQSFEALIDKDTYFKEIAGARKLCRELKYFSFLPENIAHHAISLIAALINPHFGIGHGFSNVNLLTPVDTVDEWYAQEAYPCELARHTIVDRLGAIALLGARIVGANCHVQYSNHVDDLGVLRRLVEKYPPVRSD